MSAQQARIWALVKEAADQFEEDGRVDLVIQSSLDREGYELSHLPTDINAILADR